MKLNDKTCKNLKPKDKPYKKADGWGLYIDVKPTGSKLWRFKYRFNGKEKLLSFGSYPIVPLADARDRRDTARKLLANNIDPSTHKKEEKRKQILSNENTFEAIAREWWENQKSGWTANHASYNLRRLEQNIFPEIGNLPVSDIKRSEVLHALQKIQGRGANEIAYRIQGLCSRIFDYALLKELCENNPAIGLRQALSPYKKEHYASLEIKEIPEFLQILERNDARLFIHTRYAVKLLMLTFVRTGELIKATWDEFDLDKAVWEIPPERMKMKKPHTVPLCSQAVEMLKELKELSGNSEYVFPSQVSNRKHMSNNTVLGAIKRLGYQGRMTGHGFRALAMSTIKEKLHYRHEVVDRQLAHAPRNQIDAAYDRAKFLDERKVMMQDWSDYLEELEAGKNVIKASFGG